MRSYASIVRKQVEDIMDETSDYKVLTERISIDSFNSKFKFI
jgi:hypothetical protein